MGSGIKLRRARNRKACWKPGLYSRLNSFGASVRQMHHRQLQGEKPGRFTTLFVAVIFSPRRVP
jgi:hypothetical protein